MSAGSNPPHEGSTPPFMRRLLRLLRVRVWIAERLQPTEWQTTLLWAALAGFFGALVALGFKEATEGMHRLLPGSGEDAVDTFREMPPWVRLAVPTIGG